MAGGSPTLPLLFLGSHFYVLKCLTEYYQLNNAHWMLGGSKGTHRATFSRSSGRRVDSLWGTPPSQWVFLRPALNLTPLALILSCLISIHRPLQQSPSLATCGWIYSLGSRFNPWQNLLAEYSLPRFHLQGQLSALSVCSITIHHIMKQP